MTTQTSVIENDLETVEYEQWTGDRGTYKISKYSGYDVSVDDMDIGNNLTREQAIQEIADYENHTWTNPKFRHIKMKTEVGKVGK